MRKRIAYVAIAAGLAIAALAGCNNSSEEGFGKATRVESVKNQGGQGAQVAEQSPQPAPSSATPSAPATPAAPSTAAGTTVSVVQNPELGPILVDSEGFTLYRFDKDSANPPQSNCEGDCIKKWPAAVSPVDWKAVTVTGIDRSLVGSIERADGTCQLTIADWPVYRFAQDAQPGDVKGHGVGGTWFAINAEGKKVPVAAASGQGGESTTPAAPSAPAGNYSYDY